MSVVEGFLLPNVVIPTKQFHQSRWTSPLAGCAIWNCAYKDLLSSSCDTVSSPVSDQVRTVSWLLGEDEHDVRKPMILGV